jgi:hypothetical protein
MQIIPGNVGTGAIKSAHARGFHLVQKHLISSGNTQRVQNGLRFAVYGSAFAAQTPPLSITLPFTGSEEQAP